MSRTEAPRTSAGFRDYIALFADLLAVGGALVACAAFLWLSAVHLARPLAIVIALSLVAVGAAEMYRVRHCPRSRRSARRGAGKSLEEGFDRLCIAAGLIQLVLALFLLPLVTASIGAIVTVALVVAGIRRPVRWSPAGGRPRRGRIKASLVALLVIGISVFAYVGLAAALVVSEVDEKGDASKAKRQRKDESRTGSQERAGEDVHTVVEAPVPTYAESCRELPDPALIGHGLGELFERDGAFKAGCGTRPRKVPGIATWIAAGVCEGATRSAAVSPAAGEPVLLYGDAAEFAWDEALHGNLVGAEAATPDGGDVDLIETLGGTHAFVRSAPLGGGDDKPPTSCTDVTGASRPFAHLPPQMVYAWKSLLEWRAAWSWPEEQGIGSEVFSFVVYAGGEATAYGSCHLEAECQLEVDGSDWLRGEGTSYVTLEELRPYMPAERAP